MGPMGPMSVGSGMMPGAGMPYGTPYPGNTLMMSGMGSEYGGPMVDSYPPTIMRTPSVYGDRRSMYDYDDRDRYYDYDDEYRGRRRSLYDDDDYRYRRSSSRSSRRSRRRDYDDYYDRDYDYDYDYDRGYYSDRYGRRSSSYYPSSSRYYSSSSGSRRREDMSVISKRDGSIKVLRNGEERLGDRFRRLLGMDPKGVNVVRLKRGESIATSVRR